MCFVFCSYGYVQWGGGGGGYLILYVCPLTKKLSVYNFNGVFIWTVRDRIQIFFLSTIFKKSVQINLFAF